MDELHARGFLVRDISPGEFSVCIMLGDDDRPEGCIMPVWLEKDAPNGFTAGDVLDLSELDGWGVWRGLTYSFNQELVIPHHVQ